ncbi:MAG: hypothetical protein TRG1_3359 [Flavobacteriaceae bacterium FS1-H7996/R]|nr:MAG: hypothetical protein TRG1_3359 [Flavobacteriaceae bacterium FS1-H7996/R]
MSKAYREPFCQAELVEAMAYIDYCLFVDLTTYYWLIY